MACRAFGWLAWRARSERAANHYEQVFESWEALCSCNVQESLDSASESLKITHFLLYSCRGQSSPWVEHQSE